MKPTAVILSAVLLAGATPLAADSPAADDMAWRIRREALEHSQIMKTLHMLTDVYGPRLTGSPNLKQAGEWAAGQMKTWGLVEHASRAVGTRPSGMAERTVQRVPRLAGEGLARGRSARVDAVHQRTGPRGDRQADAARLSVGGRAEDVSRQRRRHRQRQIVLVGEPKVVARRHAAAGQAALGRQTARARFDPVNPAPSPFARSRSSDTDTGRADARAGRTSRSTQFLVAHHAGVRVNDAGREHGQIRAFNNRTFDVAKAVPTIVLRNEDYGRIWRLMAERAGRARGQRRQPRLPGRRDRLQHDRRDPRHGQGRRGRDARRAPRLVALGDRRD